MICSPCFDAKTIPKCIDILVIAKTDIEDDTELTIYWEVASTGRVEKFEGIVIDGNIQSVDEVKFPTGTIINLWVTLSSDQQNKYVEFTLDDIKYTCISFVAKSLISETYSFF